jgi:hypothetical protein
LLSNYDPGTDAERVNAGGLGAPSDWFGPYDGPNYLLGGPQDLEDMKYMDARTGKSGMPQSVWECMFARDSHGLKLAPMWKYSAKSRTWTPLTQVGLTKFYMKKNNAQNRRPSGLRYRNYHLRKGVRLTHLRKYLQLLEKYNRQLNPNAARVNAAGGGQPGGVAGVGGGGAGGGAGAPGGRRGGGRIAAYGAGGAGAAVVPPPGLNPAQVRAFRQYRHPSGGSQSEYEGNVQTPNAVDVPQF